MSLLNYDSKVLGKAMALLQKRDELKAKLSVLEKEIEALEIRGGATASVSTGAPKLRKTRAKRTPIKDSIIAVLKAAGKEGIEPKTIAAKINGTPLQVNAWLAGTGKKLKEVKKLGRGQYAWVE